MLSKKQLEDIVNCESMDCKDCSAWDNCGYGFVESSKEIAQTALTYRNMLERHFISEGHYSSLEELAEVETLLKESEGEEG